MGLRETESTTVMVLERIESTLSNMEQMSFDSINITDRLITLMHQARGYAERMKCGSYEERMEAFDHMCEIQNQILETTYSVNNIVHNLEKETVYQRETVENIKQIVEFLYAMTDEMEI